MNRAHWGGCALILMSIGGACSGSVERVPPSDAIEAIARVEPELLAAANAASTAANARGASGNERCSPAPAGLGAGSLGDFTTVCAFTDVVYFYSDNTFQSGLAYSGSASNPRLFDACLRTITANWTQFRRSGAAEPNCAPGFKWNAGG